MFRLLGRTCSGFCAPCPADSKEKVERRKTKEPDAHKEPVSPPGEPPRDRNSALVNAVLCYVLLEVLHCLGFSLFAWGRSWALFCCIFFWLWHRTEPSSRPPPKWIPKAEEPSQPLEVFLETLARELDERKPPADAGDLQAASWQDISTKGAGVYIKFLKEPVMSTQVCMYIDSQKQEPNFPWIEAQNDRLAGGAVPIFLALELWPAWFPFCQKAEKLAHLGPNKAIYLLRFKITFLTVDIVLMAALVDNISRNGRLELLFAGPQKGLKKWMGITVPAKTASFRYVIPGMRLSVQPETTCSGKITLQAETIDEVQFDWAVKMFWRACASRIIGIIARMQRRYEGSTLQAHHNAPTPEAEEQRRQFLAVKERLAQHCAGIAGE
mmetsp:Transcript_9815/g.23599  ORF Transcript_9815/g.23599 Transcript_9815/m.23599 type:complete len:382 (-) Transcript_9815:4-1149(-)